MSLSENKLTLEANLSFDCLKVDGGAVSNNFLMQFQADLLDRPVERPQQIETTALGAAYLAGLTVGVWSDMTELEKYRKVDQVFTPSMSTSIRQEKLAGWKTAVDQVIEGAVNWQATPHVGLEAFISNEISAASTTANNNLPGTDEIFFGLRMNLTGNPVVFGKKDYKKNMITQMTQPVKRKYDVLLERSSGLTFQVRGG